MRRGAVYPPSIPHTSTRLSPTAALSRISAYLSASESNNPHLHPDALLEPGGITLRTSAGSGPQGGQGGIVMHHLRRIKAGLGGEVLALDAEELMFTQGQSQGQAQTQMQTQLQGTDAGSQEAAFPKRWKSNVGQDGMPIKSALKKPTATTTTQDDGIDGETYALQQRVLEGGPGGDFGEHEEGAPWAQTGTRPPVIRRAGLTDKEARKADKKAKRKREKAEREEARKGR